MLLLSKFLSFDGYELKIGSPLRVLSFSKSPLVIVFRSNINKN